MDIKDVRVLSPFVGGGFGGKVSVWSHTFLCALATKVVGRPVRLSLSREEVYRVVGGRTQLAQRLALGADQNGKLASLVHTGVTAQSFNNDWPEQFTFPSRNLYAADSFLISQLVTNINQVATTYMRAPGDSVGNFALESAIDELSWQVGMDPIELRKVNEPKRDPVKGNKFSNRNLIEPTELAPKLSDGLVESGRYVHNETVIG